MTVLKEAPVWKQRFERIDSDVDDIRIPQNGENNVDQDEEWCEVVTNGECRRIRFHDYDRVFEIPGLYEELFYNRLKCCSPSRIVSLLVDVAADFQADLEQFRVLDVGAGNGMVGDELKRLGVRSLVGIDIIDEAREAALRDRPGVYSDYFVADLTELPDSITEKLRTEKFNCLTTVAALGYGDIPPAAFIGALNLISAPGWMAFNIKEDFLREKDDTGFSRLVRLMMRHEYIQVQSYRRYRHRLSITGEPLYYVAIIARKLRELPEDVLQRWELTG